ncbi:hypothetical protein K488DRAFT_70926 [Vararia minispora EC-137]|uniref:Uncharacterized protein n=1 Tax=Vararia minispora EC-137 TaxID=1314806 RepID=A0ACB8QK11_9AGAM|nr:hypothetical protein K488DRAFT_70926 [Vararia minispora EC-137]
MSSNVTESPVVWIDKRYAMRTCTRTDRGTNLSLRRESYGTEASGAIGHLPMGGLRFVPPMRAASTRDHMRSRRITKYERLCEPRRRTDELQHTKTTTGVIVAQTLRARYRGGACATMVPWPARTPVYLNGQMANVLDLEVQRDGGGVSGLRGGREASRIVRTKELQKFAGARVEESVSIWLCVRTLNKAQKLEDILDDMHAQAPWKI